MVTHQLVTISNGDAVMSNLEHPKPNLEHEKLLPDRRLSMGCARLEPHF